MEKIALVGWGNVGYHLSREIARQGYRCTVLFRTEPEKKYLEGLSDKIEFVDSFGRLHPETEVIFLTVKDGQIEKVAAQMPDEVRENACLLHSSGVLPADILRSLAPKRGLFYPLNSFSKDLPFHWTDVPVFIETNRPETTEFLRKLAERAGAKAVENNDKAREDLHLAAVFANNFTNHLFALSSQMVKEAGIPFEYLHPLIKTTVQKALDMDPANAQTGPAIRRDFETIKKHLNKTGDPQLRELYKQLSQSIQNLDKKRTK